MIVLAITLIILGILMIIVGYKRKNKKIQFLGWILIVIWFATEVPDFIRGFKDGYNSIN